MEALNGNSLENGGNPKRSRFSPPRFVFAGDRQIAVDALAYLCSQDARPLGLILPDRATGSHAGALLDLCRHLPDTRLWFGPQFQTQDAIETLRSLDLDYIICVHFQSIVPSSVLRIPARGVLNLHPAYLPYNRGWHTSIWTILNNSPFGATLHFMSEDLDAGDIVHQKLLAVNPEDTGHTLYQRVLQLELEVFREAWPSLADYSYVRKPQLHKSATAHKRKDLFLSGIQEIDLNQVLLARDLINRLRAFTTDRPEEALFFTIDGCRYRVQIKISKEAQAEARTSAFEAAGA